MRVFFCAVIVLVFSALAVEDYSLPGINSDEILMPVNVWGEVRNPGLHMAGMLFQRQADLLRVLTFQK
ncbi:MAG: hypothetical protein K8S62_00985 [Candidatus Sabulitectum sp.]|nr:hypothetical protein [Candidatus Sabulitectum sp.]